MKKSLGVRFITYMIVINVLAFTILGLLLYNQLKQVQLSQQKKQLYYTAHALANQLADLDLTKSLAADSLTYLQYTSQTNDVRLTLISTSGQVFFDSEQDPALMENHLDRPEVKKALSGEPACEVHYSWSTQNRMLYVAYPIMRNNQVSGIVRLSTDVKHLENAWANLRNLISGALAITALFMILTSIGFIITLTRPLKALTNQINDFQAGKSNEFIPGRRQDEIGQLEKAFSLMTQQVNLRFQQLSAQSNRLDSILNQMTDGILIVNRNGNVEQINPAANRMFGLSPNEALNKSVVEVLRQFQLVELWKSAGATGKQQTTTVETPVNRLYIQAIATPIVWSEPGSIMIAFQDLTRMHRLELIRKDFVSNASHELRTPLSSLKALAETLHETVEDDPENSQKFLLRMDQELDNLTQMVNELLEISKIESGKSPLNREEVDVEDILHDADERMRLQAERNGINMIVTYPPSTLKVNADNARISQVMTNLIHNAIKFTQPGGSIHVSASEDRQNVIFKITDTGIGIDPELLPRIFERFYKTDRSRASSGAGLGLSISRHIVEAHGGEIRAESQLNCGSSFYFSLPKHH